MGHDSVIVQLRGINKRFDGVHAVKNVDFDICKGEVHALVGENGAGKSTLMKIIAGALTPDSGEIIWEGRQVHLNNPRTAYAQGVRIVYQEFNLIEDLTVAENIFLGQTRMYQERIALDRSRMIDDAKKLLDDMQADINPRAMVRDLTVAQQQLVELAKAFSDGGGKVLIMDEPTSPLSEKETEVLFQVMQRFKRKGVGIVFISHRLNEILPISDRVTVIRDGVIVGSQPSSEMTMDRLVSMVIGRNLKALYPKVKAQLGEVVFSVRDIRGRRFCPVTFDLHKGEILGIYGLVGSGRSEMARAIFGVDKIASGELWLEGRRVTFNSIRDAISHQLAFITEDRKRDGLCFNMSVAKNVCLLDSKAICTSGVIQFQKMAQKTHRLVRVLDIATYDPFEQLVSQLSGGNQQKVVLAKWFGITPKILIMDEPTRGIDVGTKAEIYRLMTEFVAQGNAIVMISSELNEIMSMSDRILVMRRGQIVGNFVNRDLDREVVVRCAMGQ